jgi:hypothetical protein
MINYLAEGLRKTVSTGCGCFSNKQYEYVILILPG